MNSSYVQDFSVQHIVSIDMAQLIFHIYRNQESKGRWILTHSIKLHVQFLQGLFCSDHMVQGNNLANQSFNQRRDFSSWHCLHVAILGPSKLEATGGLLFPNMRISQGLPFIHPSLDEKQCQYELVSLRGIVCLVPGYEPSLISLLETFWTLFFAFALEDW